MSTTTAPKSTLTVTINDAATAKFVGAAASARVSFEPDAGAVVIGRSVDADIQLVDAVGRVSRAHLVFEWVGHRWTVADTASKHGSTILRLGDPRGDTQMEPHQRYDIRTTTIVTVAKSVILQVEVTAANLAGELTAGTAAADDAPVTPLGTPTVAKFAVSLLREREPVTVINVAQRVGCDRTHVYTLARKLADDPKVRPHLELDWSGTKLPNGWLDDLRAAARMVIG